MFTPAIKVALYSGAILMFTFFVEIDHSNAQETQQSLSSVPPKRLLFYRRALAGNLNQRYEIELLEDGSGVFRGHGNVYQFGKHEIGAPVAKLKEAIDRIWKQPDPPGKPAAQLIAPRRDSKSVPPPHGLPQPNVDVWQLTVAKDNQEKNFLRASSSGSYDKWIRRVLDEVVSTRRFRCPYFIETEIRISARRVLPKGSDVCSFQDEVDANTQEFIEIKGESK